MHRRRAIATTSAIAAAVIAAVVVTLLVTRGGSTVAVGTTHPTSYLIVYRVIQNGAPHWEVLSVQRPFTVSDLTYTTTSAPRAGDQASTGNMSTATALYAVDAQTVRLVSGRQPGPPSGDQYAGEAIHELTRRGLAGDLSQTATVAGRTCRLYRFAAPPSGAVAPLTSTADSADHDDLCFDSEGLELSESWTYRGAVVLQRTAVDFRFPDPQNPSQTAATSVVWGFIFPTRRGPRRLVLHCAAEAQSEGRRRGPARKAT